MDPTEYGLFDSFVINGYFGFPGTWSKTGRKQPPEEMAGFTAKCMVPPA